MRQEAHPAADSEVPRIDGGIAWRALLSGVVVHPCGEAGRFLHLAQLDEEMRDDAHHGEGLAAAFENMSPIDIDDVRVVGGEAFTRRSGSDPDPSIA